MILPAIYWTTILRTSASLSPEILETIAFLGGRSAGFFC
jgi:hypothetical protein